MAVIPSNRGGGLRRQTRSIKRDLLYREARFHWPACYHGIGREISLGLKMYIWEQAWMKGRYLLAAVAGLWASIAVADDSDVLAIHGDVSRSLFGGGTGVVIGFVDSGIDSTHPALTGNDSLGHARLFSVANFVAGEPTTDDISISLGGHGTP